MIEKKDYSILLVEDEKAFRDLVRYELETEGYTNILEAEDGEEALTLITEKHVDLMLLDLGMPRMDGMEVLRNIRENNPPIAVIVLTGRGDREVKKAALDLGAVAFIEKPYDHEGLFASIDMALRRDQQ